MKFSIVLRYCGDFAAQLNILACNAAHLIKRLDIPGLDTIVGLLLVFKFSSLNFYRRNFFVFLEI